KPVDRFRFEIGPRTGLFPTLQQNPGLTPGARICRRSAASMGGGIVRRITTILFATVTFTVLFLSATGLGQSINATVGGTVSDPSGALIPGVTVTATNTATGIVNTIVTNEAGAYNFAALQPGTYKATAELPGFQTQTFTDVQLGGAQQVTLNFKL